MPDPTPPVLSPLALTPVPPWSLTRILGPFCYPPLPFGFQSHPLLEPQSNPREEAQSPWDPTQTQGGRLQEVSVPKAPAPARGLHEADCGSTAWQRHRRGSWSLAPSPVTFTCVSLFPLQKAPPSEVRGPPLTSRPSALTSPLSAMRLPSHPSGVCVCLWSGPSVAAGDLVGIQLWGQAVPLMPA